MAGTFEELIEAKRDGREHSREELDRVVLGFAAGEVPDYQMAAWLMAAFLRGLSPEETVYLTDAMVRSGKVVDLSVLGRPAVDKHSTGGVADTTTLVVAPVVASLGVPVAKMSGRGLGHTGGTLDKLESIPGFRVELSPEEMVAQVRRVGIAVVAQSPEVDPADKAMYALRDVTATVPSVPLIVGSIISKKVAGGASGIVLDVKFGSGAFMKTEEAARGLARELTRVGAALGKRVVCVLSDMDEPLGDAVGNALEVREAIEVLVGRGPSRLVGVCLALAAKMLVLGGAAGDEAAARAMAEEAISAGRAASKFEEWVEAQGGPRGILEEAAEPSPGILPRSPVVHAVLSPRAGYLTGFDAEGVGRSAMLLGAGRATKSDAIDPAAGLVLRKRPGDRVESGEPLADLHASSAALVPEAEARFLAAARFGEAAPASRPLFVDVEGEVEG